MPTAPTPGDGQVVTECEPAPDPLAVRLLRARRALRRVPKRGWNDHHKYRYATEADVKRAVRRALDREGILALPAVTGPVEHHGTLTTVPMEFRFIAADTGEELRLPWAGVGFDKGGDKGIYKAFTGATKYLMLGAFLIETGDEEDPERDRTSGRDASVPRIPRDRAKRIVDSAKAAGIDEPVFMAAVRDAGASRVVDLTVDQAEDVEAFIRTESDS